MINVLTLHLLSCSCSKSLGSLSSHKPTMEGVWVDCKGLFRVVNGRREEFLKGCHYTWRRERCLWSYENMRGMPITLYIYLFFDETFCIFAVWHTPLHNVLFNCNMFKLSIFSSLQALKNALDAKGTLLDEIMEKADKLQEEDGKKPNGTRDVDSRCIIDRWYSNGQIKHLVQD